MTCNNTTRNILRYWRNSLADLDIMGFDGKDVLAKGFKFSMESFQNGHLNLQPWQIKKLFPKEKKSNPRYSKSPEKDPLNEKKPILIAPYTVSKKHEHGKEISQNAQTRILFPLWLFADLTKQGKLLSPQAYMNPWIARPFLTPNQEHNSAFGYPIMGDVSEVDDFYNEGLHQQTGEKNSWEATFSFAHALFTKLTGEDPETFFKKQGFILSKTGYFLKKENLQSYSRTIIKTYDQYIGKKIKNPTLPKTLHAFCTLEDPPRLPDKSDEALYLASQKHFGQAHNQYPLSKSQRIALSYFNDTKDDPIFTVHGPPGTGKTTLLISVIVSQWIGAALKKQPPPIVVAASTNNLAVLNILDAFNRIGQAHSEQTSIRWLLTNEQKPFESYGTYLVSNNKVEGRKKEQIKYPYLTSQKNKTPAVESMYCDKEHRDKMKQYFLDKFNETYSKQEHTLKACQAFFHEKMLEKKRLLEETILFVKDFHDFKNDCIQNDQKNLEKKLEERKACLDLLKQMQQEERAWLKYKTKTLTSHLLIATLAWFQFPPAKKILLDKARLFFANSQFIQIKKPNAIGQFDDALENHIDHQKKLLADIDNQIEAIKQFKAKQDKFLRKNEALEKQLGFSLETDNLFDFSLPNNVLSKLDQTIRYELFVLATHYWEASWLIETDKPKPHSRSQKDNERYWQIQAMLTPCLVSTLHTGPNFFKSGQDYKTLSDFIDLLIIDEAGQVMAPIAGAMISTAKKVMLFGDANQIAPISNFPEAIDFGNAKKFNLCANQHEYERLKEKGILCSKDNITNEAYSNLILLGQRKARYHLKDQSQPGMLLREHRRCADGIIAYCNELCYDNQLLPMTPHKPCDFPRMGYAHIKGDAIKNGSSWLNQIEAKVIIAWLQKNKTKILENCQENNLDSCIGIITPFAPQKNYLEKLIKENGLGINKVGTVHALQGAEKPIIIFSPVYVSDNKMNSLFFDQSPNMLNVAVSRAKESFLVFGDMDIFEPNKGKKPSSLLATYLFDKPENEIVDIDQTNLFCDPQDIMEQLTTLEKHREALKKAFLMVNHELNIVTPYLSVNAIQYDNIANLIKQSLKKNVKINIYTDPILNQEKKHFKEAISILKNAGARVHLVENVHSKIITIDNTEYIVGSFNWLGASRFGQYVRQEDSIICRGARVHDFIQKTIKAIQAKMKTSKDLSFV